MTIKALHCINTGVELYKPGDIITGLSSTDEEALIAVKAAERTVEIPQDENQLTQEVEPGEVLEGMLRKFNKAEIIQYADKAEIPIQDKEATKDVIIAEIVADANANGVDVEAFSFAQLKRFATGLGFKYADTIKQEELLNLVTEK